MLDKMIVTIGIGEMAGVFCRGLLRCAYPLFPVTRKQSLAEVAQYIPHPYAVLVAVGEADLDNILSHIPKTWKNNLILLQNELLPSSWESHAIYQPTVISVWFEKKKGQDYKVLIPSPVFGQHASLVANALDNLAIPVRILDNKEQLLLELVIKNVYILTTNIAGLKVGGNVAQLWEQHQEFARYVANEIIQLQSFLTGQTFDKHLLINGMVTAIQGDLEHKCMGRSAPARLQRALQQAEAGALHLPILKEIYAKYVNT